MEKKEKTGFLILIFNPDLVAGERSQVSVGNGGGKSAAGLGHVQGLQQVATMFPRWCLHNQSIVPGSIVPYLFGNVGLVWSRGFR